MSSDDLDTRPAFGKSSFRCPHCGVVSQVHEMPVLKGYKGDQYFDRNDPFMLDNLIHFKAADFFDLYPGRNYLITRCSHCCKLHFWADKQLVYPMGSGISPVKCMPENVKGVFNEAQQITNASPRAACALLRICLERLVKQLGAQGRNLEQKVKSLGLSPRLQKLCDVCRLAGNEAVHREGFDFSINNPEALSLAHALSVFINRLTDDFIGLEMEANQYRTALDQAANQTAKK